jgi:hypothetical protein
MPYSGFTYTFPCSPGSYSPYSGSTTCTLAFPGAYVPDYGATSWTSCSPGSYSSSSGATACAPAPAGSYVAFAGATAPTPCPAGTYQYETGQTSCVTAVAPHVLLPGDGSSISGGAYFVSDAAANATRVEFRASGPAGPDVHLGDAVLTPYGWFLLPSLGTLPEGVYTLTSVAHFGSVTVSSAPTTFRIDRTKPTTAVIVPATNGATLRGANGVLDASASDNVGVTRVEFRLNGGTVQNRTIGTATLTYFGWISIWDTTTAPNGTYNLRSVAFDAAGNSQASAPRAIKIAN